MLWVRHAMALLLLLTAIWLLWIIGLQQGIITAIFIGILSICAIILLARTHYKKIVSIGFILGTVLVISMAPALPPSSSNTDQSVWQDFSPEHILEAVNDGRIVFVDLTAAWCLTCKFNKFTTLDTTNMQQFFNTHHVLTMRGDWTNKNEIIRQFLQDHQRAGVPFNAVFCSNAAHGIILPELLNQTLIEQAVKKCL